MSAVPAFYSVNEIKKPAQDRVHHNNGACPPGRDIPSWERKPGDGGYRLCEDCQKLNKEGVKRGAGQLLLSRWGAFSMLHPRLFHLKKVIDFKET
jgi:hypothetical protein